MDLLTVDETAAMLKVNPITIRRYIQSGRLPAVRVGRRVRIHKAAVEALVTPLVAKGSSISEGQYTFRPPTTNEIARRQALFHSILRNREQRRIDPLTSADLVHIAREQEVRKYGDR